jgi:prevent-host-death family protein
MDSVGVRELRQRASDLLRRVASGESIEVTDRGRPVAILVPVDAKTPLDRLRAAGQTTGPSRGFDDLPAPLALPRGAEPPSRTLLRLRADER